MFQIKTNQKGQKSQWNIDEITVRLKASKQVFLKQFIKRAGKKNLRQVIYSHLLYRIIELSKFKNTFKVIKSRYQPYLSPITKSFPLPPCLLNTSRDGIYLHFPGQTVPMLDHHLHEEMLPKSHLAQFEAISSCHARKDTYTLLASTSSQLQKVMRSPLSLLLSRLNNADSFVCSS